MEERLAAEGGKRSRSRMRSSYVSRPRSGLSSPTRRTSERLVEQRVERAREGEVSGERSRVPRSTKESGRDARKEKEKRVGRSEGEEVLKKKLDWYRAALDSLI